MPIIRAYLPKKERMKKNKAEAAETIEKPDSEAPPWKHITKASKRQGIQTSFDDHDDDDWRSRRKAGSLWGVPRQPPHYHGPMPSEIKEIKMYKIPVNYLATAYVYISARNLDEAIQKGMSVEAPEIMFTDTTAHETEIVSEVMASEARELEE